MLEAFHAGGWGMIPTSIFGLVLLAISVRYAVKPERRWVPLLVSSGIVTLVSGLLGFVTGLIKSLQAITEVPAEDRFIWLVGLGESLNNVALALALVLLAALAAFMGTMRLAREAT